MSKTEQIEAERSSFEAAGAKVHGWGTSDYRRPVNWEMELDGDYDWLEVRRAFALWLAAKGIDP